MKKIFVITLALTTALTTSNPSFAQEGNMDQNNAPTMDLETSQWGIGLNAPPPWGFLPGGAIMPWGLRAPPPSGFSIFDPLLLDIPSGGKGIPVHDANDSTKIIGYVILPERPKPTGPVHCAINEKSLLAKSVDDCEAAGGTVAP